jgi:two-component system response regulator PilR (NtrC family)
MPASLLESELFGHVRGAFTGADRDKRGLFVAAEGGTLLLDEIGEMPMEMQPKLLRVLEDHKVRPVGATEEIPTNVRVLAATNRDLQADAVGGRFREDLFYRLNVIQIDLPPLRERREDIPLLAEHFLEGITAADGAHPIGGFSHEAKQLIESYDWPGNVRELENAVRRAATLETTAVIQASNLPDSVRGLPERALRTGELSAAGGDEASWAAIAQRAPDETPGDVAAVEHPGGETSPPLPTESIDLEAHLEKIRRQHMLRALAECGGVQKKAAARLGMTFRSFRYYVAKLGLLED